MRDSRRGWPRSGYTRPASNNNNEVSVWCGQSGSKGQHRFAGSGYEGSVPFCWIRIQRINIDWQDTDPKEEHRLAGSGSQGSVPFLWIRIQRINNDSLSDYVQAAI